MSGSVVMMRAGLVPAILLASVWLVAPGSAGAATPWYETASTFATGIGAATQEAGGTLVMRDLRMGDFRHLGPSRVQRDAVRRASRVLNPYRAGARSMSKSLPFKVAPHLLVVSEVATSCIAPAMEGDWAGAAGGAANVVGGNLAVIGGAEVFGALGTGTGAAIGSFVPVIGTAAGAMVGGAVGRVAGSFIGATAYDLYVKEAVGSGVEGMLADIHTPYIDVSLQREAALRRQAIWMQSYGGDGPGGLREVEAYPPHTLVPGLDPSDPLYTALAPSPEAAPDPPQPEVALTSRFDAIPVSGTWELSNGDSGSFGPEVMAEAEGDPCNVIAFRDGYFYSQCDEAMDHGFEKGTVHIDTGTTLMGTVAADGTLDGWFLIWARNFNVGFSDRDDVEYMRSYNAGRITGAVRPDGTIGYVMEFQRNQVYDRPADWVGEYLHYGEGWIARDMEANGYSVRTTVELRVTGTDVEGTLRRPDITADTIRAQDFALPPAFFENGASPPPY